MSYLDQLGKGATPEKAAGQPQPAAAFPTNQDENPVADEVASAPPTTVDLRREYEDAGVREVLEELDRELVGLKPVKKRIRETAALLLVERARRRLGLAHETPTLHMSFTGNPGTGKTTVALKMANLLHRLGYIRKGHLVSVTRDDLVGQYIGHTAPKTKDILKKAMGGVLFIDEAYYLYRPENERDYGQEAIEILLQVMENQRDDLVVILAGYADRMDRFFESNPGFRSRIAHHIDFPDYSNDELHKIAVGMLERQNYHLTEDATAMLSRYIEHRRGQPHFANARSIRNALDRARLRQANRLFEAETGPLDAAALSEIAAEDIAASRVFLQKPGRNAEYVHPESERGDVAAFGNGEEETRP
ncbi:CbbX protein [Jiella avicenniae]|uniref:CbbX protein n=1 Tax=Jiella avicenniae TaxID=2907202 RepID=A0A9X1TBB1_9HYPH|nr:CbbX protein [Jiella avicenniae]MCE7027958.1 CbbX protein [Jiella avicenniae]